MTSPYREAPHSRRGRVPLYRLGGSLPFESTIEERCAQVLDTVYDVVSLKRGEPLTLTAPDGSQTTYTPDYLVGLRDGRQFTVECKPKAALFRLVESELAAWSARSDLLHQQGTPLRFLTDDDFPRAWLSHVHRFGACYQIGVKENISETVLEVVQSRGPLPFSDLRAVVHHVSRAAQVDVDAAISHLIAHHCLSTDISVYFRSARVGLPEQLALPTCPEGLSLRHVLTQPTPEQEAPVASLPPRLRQFIDSERGGQYLRLFSAYSDPSEPLKKARVTELCERCGMTRSSIFRFRELLTLAGAPGITFEALVPYLIGAGGTRNRVDVKVFAIMERLAQETYFVRLGTTGRARGIADLYEIVRRECLAEELPPPAYNTIRAHVQDIQNRDPVKAALRREGDEAAQKLEARQGHLDITMYGELIAVDCTPTDIFMRDAEVWMQPRRNGFKKQKDVAWRGNVVTVIDVATGEVLRSEVFAGAISAARVLRVLQDIFLGNTEKLTKAGVKVVPQASGLPKRVRIDSGTEFLNRAVTNALSNLGIDVLTRNKRFRHHGGREERTIGTLIHTHQMLVGTSAHTIEARGEYDAQKHAVLTREDVDRFQQRILERYNALDAEGQLMGRHEHALHLISTGESLWRPATQAQLEYLQKRMHPVETRTCLPTGINLHGLTYQSPHLEPLIFRRAHVDVYYSPEDVSTAYVVHPDNGQVIEVATRFPQGIEGPLSLEVWQDIRKRVRVAHRARLDSAKTVRQIAQETMSGHQARHDEFKRQKRKEASAVKVASLKPRANEGDKKIKAAKIKFDIHPPVTGVDA